MTAATGQLMRTLQELAHAQNNVMQAVVRRLVDARARDER